MKLTGWALWDGVSLKQEMLVRGSCTWQMNHRTLRGIKGYFCLSDFARCYERSFCRYDICICCLTLCIPKESNMFEKSTVILALECECKRQKSTVCKTSPRLKSPMYFSLRLSVSCSEFGLNSELCRFTFAHKRIFFRNLDHRFTRGKPLLFWKVSRTDDGIIKKFWIYTNQENR